MSSAPGGGSCTRARGGVVMLWSNALTRPRSPPLGALVEPPAPTIAARPRASRTRGGKAFPARGAEHPARRADDGCAGAGPQLDRIDAMQCRPREAAAPDRAAPAERPPAEERAAGLRTPALRWRPTRPA